MTDRQKDRRLDEWANRRTVGQTGGRTDGTADNETDWKLTDEHTVKRIYGQSTYDTHIDK